ncbi:phage portal protein [Cellulosilyticum sp. I15G10I2]|uniref:phage portal protein n=1 Tax=Cellulosilyticum sp. I15G10I2 TaxID=1892843 RepID=UPI00085C606A|nr:phage portal protein [Cellulosilyticum sp. I15G10I2]
MFYIDKNKALTTELIDKYIEVFKANQLPRLQKLKRYYDCKNDTIINRTFADTTKPNVKIATPWGKYISDIVSAYFIGKPVTYTSKDSALLEELSAIFRYNDESTKNQQLAIDMSIYGIAYELLYLSEDKVIRFSTINPQTVIPIYDNSISEDLLYCIRFFDTKDILTDEVVTNIEVYTDSEIISYEKNKNGTVLIDSISHYFGEVPVNVYKNNNDTFGDFEKVIPLVDGYDLSLSDTANAREELNNSYLVFKNTNLEDTDILSMKEKRIIQIEDAQEGMQSAIQFLNKDSNDIEAENYKSRLEKDIHKFSYVNDLLDTKSHTSATQARLGMMGLEQLTAIKESYFKYALIRRIEMICNILSVTGSTYNFNDIAITFVRNIPLDITVLSDALSKLLPFVSRETLLSQLPFVSDVEEEMEKIAKENEINSYLMGSDVDE